MSEHLLRRGGRYYYRRRVPADLIARYGKKEHQQALGTSDPKEAAVLARLAAVELDAVFTRLRTPPKEYKSITAEEAEQQELDAEESAKVFHTNVDVEIHQHELAEQMKAAIRQAMHRKHTPRPLVPSVEAQSTHAPDKPHEAGMGLAEALRQWEKDRSPGGSTVRTTHTIVSRFWEVCGKLPLRKIQREHILQFQVALKADGKQPGTIKNNLALLRAVLGVAVDEGWIKSNPVIGIKTNGQKSAKTARLPFTVEEINKIYGSLPMSGAKYWLPVIGLYTGLRLDEIGQLAPADVVQEIYRDAAGKEQKAYVIYATEEGDGQKLKNESSRRRVPVHRTLIDLGFIQYAHSQKGAQLFPELKPDKNGRRTASFSARFGTMKRELGITDSRKAFHSFRHVFKDVMREVGVTEEVSDALSGHSNGSASRNYGSGFYPLRPLVEAMDKYEVHGVKLPA